PATATPHRAEPKRSSGRWRRRVPPLDCVVARGPALRADPVAPRNDELLAVTARPLLRWLLPLLRRHCEAALAAGGIQGRQDGRQPPPRRPYRGIAPTPRPPETAGFASPSVAKAGRFRALSDGFQVGGGRLARLAVSLQLVRDLLAFLERVHSGPLDR